MTSDWRPFLDQAPERTRLAVPVYGPGTGGKRAESGDESSSLEPGQLGPSAASPAQRWLDDVGEVIATAAQTCAAWVDAASAPDGDVPGYARGRIISPYLRSLEVLSDHVRPVDTTDPWAEFPGGQDWAEFLADQAPRKAEPDWDKVEEAMAENPATWPEVGG
jgi:hypothetical protein